MSEPGGALHLHGQHYLLPLHLASFRAYASNVLLPTHLQGLNSSALRIPHFFGRDGEIAGFFEGFVLEPSCFPGAFSLLSQRPFPGRLDHDLTAFKDALRFLICRQDKPVLNLPGCQRFKKTL